jgi:hypothetical protein
MCHAFLFHVEHTLVATFHVKQKNVWQLPQASCAMIRAPILAFDAYAVSL